MYKDTYTLVDKFNCCGNTMVTVIIEGKATCVMQEIDYNRIIMNERRFKKKSRVVVAQSIEGLFHWKIGGK